MKKGFLLSGVVTAVAFVLASPVTAELGMTVCDATEALVRQCDFTTDGTADEVQIQAAIDGLRPQRKEQATVSLYGHFILSNTVFVESYTIIDARHALIERKASTSAFLLRNRHWAPNSFDECEQEGDTKITILGGRWDGNKDAVSAAIDNIEFRCVELLLIDGVEVFDSPRDGLIIDGRVGGITERGGQVTGVYAHDNDQDGIVGRHGLRGLLYSQNRSENNGRDGFRFDHSESSATGIISTGNARYGVYWNNVHNWNGSGWKVSYNREGGIYALAVTASSLSNIDIYRNCQNSSYPNCADFYLSDDDTWSYGVTKNLIVTGYTIGWRESNIPAFEPYGVYFEPGIDDTKVKFCGGIRLRTTGPNWTNDEAFFDGCN